MDGQSRFKKLQIGKQKARIYLNFKTTMIAEFHKYQLQGGLNHLSVLN